MVNSESDPRQKRLEQVIAEYLQAEDDGHSPSPEDYIRKHPDLADDLREFFSGQKEVEQLAEPVGPNGGECADNLEETLVTSESQDDSAFQPTIIPATEPMSPARPERKTVGYFGDYELLSEIARGGMGVVYKARQTNLDRIVALKMILTGQLASEDDVRRFYQEAEAAANLEHPGIVPIFEVGQHDGQHFFSMGYVNGPSLAQLISGGPLPPHAAAEIVALVAEAIEFAHKRGVVHRDLKPANILMARFEGQSDPTKSHLVTLSTSDAHPEMVRSFQPKVTDFGLAKKTEGGSELTGTGQILGTPSFMPPEQAAGQTQQIGPQADIYSLGAILYCLLTGRPPFQAASVMDTLMQVLEQEAVSPKKINPRVPKDLETICLKCLQKDRRKRYPSAQSLRDDLGHFLRGEPIRARPVGRTERLWMWCRRNPAWAALWAAVMFLVGVLSLGGPLVAYEQMSLRQEADTQRERANRKADEAKQNYLTAETERKRADQEAQAAKKSEQRVREENLMGQRRLYDAHMNLAWQAWEDHQVDQVVELLKRQQPDQTGGIDLRGFAWHYLNRLTRSDLRSISGERRASKVWDLAISPDGRHVAITQEKAVRVCDLSTGREIKTLGSHAASTVSLAYSPDGTQLAVGDHMAKITIWNLPTEKKLHTLSGGGFPRKLSFTPDGRHLLGQAFGGVKVWDVETTELVGTFPEITGQSFALSPDGQRVAIASLGNSLTVWDRKSEQQITKIDAPLLTGLTGVAFLDHGQKVIGVGTDGKLRVWNAQNGAPIHSIIIDGSGLLSVVVSPDGHQIAMTTIRGSVLVYDARTFRRQQTLRGHTDRTHAVSFSPDGRLIVSGSDDGSIKVWDRRSGQDVTELPANSSEYVAFAGEDQLVTAHETVKNWDLRTDQFQGKWDTRRGAVVRFALSPDGHLVAGVSLTDKKTIWLRQRRNGRPVGTFPNHPAPIRCLAFRGDGAQLASVDEKGTIRIWDVQTKEVLQEWSCEFVGDSLAFSRDGKQLAVATMSSFAIHLYDVPSEQLRHALKGHQNTVRDLTFDPTGKRLASAAADNTVRVWKTDTGKPQSTLRGHGDSVNKVRFLPQERLASVASDGALKIWDLATAQETLSLPVHSLGAIGLDVSPSGQRLAAVGADGSVRIFDSHTPTEAQRQEREARGLVEYWIDQGYGRESLQAKIEASPAVTKTVREKASELANQYEQPESSSPESARQLAIIRQLRPFGARAQTNEQGRVVWMDFWRSQAHHLTQGDFALLGELPHLVSLDLSNTPLSDAGFVRLGKLPELKVLDVSETRITATGLMHLQNFPNLEVLRLKGVQLDDLGLVFLKPLRKLRILELAETSVSDSGLSMLASLDQLTELNLNNTTISDEGLSSLNGLSRLEILRLNHTEIGDQGLAHLTNLSKLSVLELAQTRITNQGLASLIAMSGLKHLDRRETQLSDSAVLRLLKTHPGLRVVPRPTLPATAEKPPKENPSPPTPLALPSLVKPQPFQTFEHQGRVRVTTFSPDEKQLALASHNRIAIREIHLDGTPKTNTISITSPVTDLSYSPDGKVLASADEAGWIRFWDPRTGSDIGKLQASQQGITALCYAPDGQTLIAGSEDGTISLWNRQTHQLICRLEQHKVPVVDLAVLPDGKGLISSAYRRGRDNGGTELFLWDLPKQNVETRVENLTGFQMKIDVASDGKRFIVPGFVRKAGEYETTIEIRSTDDGSLIRQILAKTNFGQGIELLSDGRFIVGGVGGATLLTSQGHPQSLLAHEGVFAISSFVVSPKEQWIATIGNHLKKGGTRGEDASYHGVIKLWRTPK